MRSLIQKGITGFSSKRNTLPVEDTKAFLTCLHNVTRAEVEWQDIDVTGKSYYWFLVTVDEHKFSFFLNAFFPIVAIRRETPQSEFGYLTSNEIFELFPDMEQCEYRVMGRELLDQELLASEVEALDEAEIKQAEYWKPRTYDEIIFNNWD